MVGVRRAGALLWILAVGGLLFWGSRLQAASFAIGGVLSYLNFVLLEQGASRALVQAASPGTASVVWRFLLRFLLYGGALYAMIGARSLDLLTATLGLSLFVFAIMLKGFADAARDLFSSGNNGSGSPG